MSGVNSFYGSNFHGNPYARPSVYPPAARPVNAPFDVSPYSRLNGMDSLIHATGGDFSPAPFFALASQVGVSRIWDGMKNAGSYLNQNIWQPTVQGTRRLLGLGTNSSASGARAGATAARAATRSSTASWAGTANKALAGVGAGFAAYDGYKRFKNGDTLGGVANFGGMGLGAMIGAGAGVTGALGGAAAGAGVALNVVDGVRAFANGDYVGGGLQLGGTAAGAVIGSAIAPGIGTLVGGAIGGVVGKLAGGLFGGGKKKAAKKATKKLTKNLKEAKGKAYEEGKKQAMEMAAQGQFQLIPGAPASGGDPKAISGETKGELKKLGKTAAKGKKKHKKEVEKKATALFEKEASAAYAQGFNEVMEGQIQQQNLLLQNDALHQEQAFLQQGQELLQQQQALMFEEAARRDQAFQQEQLMRQQQASMMQWSMLQQQMQPPAQPIFMQNNINIYNNPFYNNNFGAMA